MVQALSATAASLQGDFGSAVGDDCDVQTAEFQICKRQNTSSALANLQGLSSAAAPGQACPRSLTGYGSRSEQFTMC